MVFGLDLQKGIIVKKRFQWIENESHSDLVFPESLLQVHHYIRDYIKTTYNKEFSFSVLRMITLWTGVLNLDSPESKHEIQNTIHMLATVWDLPYFVWSTEEVNKRNDSDHLRMSFTHPRTFVFYQTVHDHCENCEQESNSLHETICGHVFCSDCYKVIHNQWASCPMCSSQFYITRTRPTMQIKYIPFDRIRDYF